MARRDRVAGWGRVAAPLLGGVRGWVYLYAATHRGIIALGWRISLSPMLNFLRIFTDTDFLIADCGDPLVTCLL